MTDIQILKRLYKEYTKKFFSKILLALFFAVILAASTSSIAWLLDPAIEKIFISHDISRKKRSSNIDKHAACWILQSALDFLKKR